MSRQRARIASAASPQPLWRLFEDITGWTDWRVDGAPFLVTHELRALPSEGTRASYAMRVDGLDAATPGPRMSAGFPELLAALKSLDEHACEGAS